MGKPVAKQGDRVVSVDTHIVMVPTPGGPVPTPLPHVFNGILNQELSTNVRVEGKFAATVGSIAQNTPPHFPTPPGVSFQKPPSNKAVIKISTSKVRINGKLCARAGDTAMTCHDPTDMPTGKVIAISTVLA